jgi:membrane peptidoglycan carboxypeptidase
MKNALAWSLNVPAVKTLYLVGIDSVLDTLHKFGITTLNDKNRYGLTLVLGGGEIKLFDLVNAYATLAADGTKHTQSIILKIEDIDGSIVEETKKDEGEQVAEPQYPRLITKILTDENLRSGLLQASLQSTIFPGYKVALKTGTTQDYRDAWAFGYTPFLTVGVWAGNTNNIAMGRQGGSLVAAIPMWSKFWREALKNYQPENFVEPEALTLPNKPMLNGEYIWSNNGKPEAHSILFYANKNDPQGPWPQNPASDPQFLNWEASVAEWARGNNLQNNFVIQNPIVPLENLSGDEIRIINVTPNNNDVRTGPFVVRATILSGNELQRIEFYQNGFLRNAINVSGKKFDYQYYFSDKLEKKNDFELRVITTNQKSQSAFFSTTQ